MDCTEDYRTCTVHAEWKIAQAEEVKTRNALRAATGIDIYQESVNPDEGREASAAKSTCNCQHGRLNDCLCPSVQRTGRGCSGQWQLCGVAP